MKMTLLQMTQNILSALNSDQVNSIGDTNESMQVAECIKTTYMNMLGRYELPEHNQLFELVSPNNPATPCIMTLSPGVSRIEWIKYFDTNPLDANNIQTDQFGAYSHDVNTDLQVNGSNFQTSSLTTNTIGTGSQTFVVASNLPINIGNILTAQAGSTLPSVNSMTGIVTGYTGSSLVINMQQTTGSGTFSLWTITASGPNFGPGYNEVTIMPVEEFIEYTACFDPTENDVGTQTLTLIENDNGWTGNFTFYFRNDTTPRHCCIIANKYVIFDGYDNTQDTTLQPSKFMCWGWVYPQWTHTDNFIPYLDQQQWPLFLNDAKSLAFYEIKNQPHQKAEKEVAQQLIAVQKWKAISNHPTYFEQLPDFGRRSWGLRRKFR